MLHCVLDAIMGRKDIGGTETSVLGSIQTIC